jgi:hypothetical protein
MGHDRGMMWRLEVAKAFHRPKGISVAAMSTTAMNGRLVCKFLVVMARIGSQYDVPTLGVNPHNL